MAKTQIATQKVWMDLPKHVLFYRQLEHKNVTNYLIKHVFIYYPKKLSWSFKIAKTQSFFLIASFGFARVRPLWLAHILLSIGDVLKSGLTAELALGRSNFFFKTLKSPNISGRLTVIAGKLKNIPSLAFADKNQFNDRISILKINNKNLIPFFLF